MARLLGVPIPERVTGSDLFEALVRGEGRALTVYFFGGPDGVAEAASARLNAMAGPMRCVGFASPGFGSVEQMSDPEIIAGINSSGAEFVVVALGARKGQAWIERNRNALDAPVISHLGAVINFVSGSLARAPVLLQKLGLEWLWRIKEEPALWGRYARDACALLLLIVTRVVPGLAYRLLGLFVNISPPGIRVEHAGDTARLVVSGSWSEADLPMLHKTLETLTLEPVDVEMDVSDLGRIGGAFIGTLYVVIWPSIKSGTRIPNSLGDSEGASRVQDALRGVSSGLDRSRRYWTCLNACRDRKELQPVQYA
jgi:N-acetylglucosaminyldiphosphoundecaprenol N-acetyl-beta-D-mannosaminyltransferase